MAGSDLLKSSLIISISANETHPSELLGLPLRGFVA